MGRPTRALALVAALLVGTSATGLAPIAHAAVAVPWSTTLPTTGDVSVPAGTEVVLDVDADLRTLVVDGTVRCAEGADLTLQAEAIHVRATGSFTCGTEATPTTTRLEVVLDGSTSSDHLGLGARSLVVEGLLSLHGRDRGVSHRTLTATVPAGSTSLPLDDTSGIEVGDRLVVTTTDFVQEHDERVTVTAVAGGTVTVTPALAYEHWCDQETHAGRTIRMCGAVGLLTHDIVVRGPASSTTSHVGGHIIAVGDGLLQLAGVELRNMGQEGRLGRYPIHWHMVDDGVGSYLRDSSVVDGFNRFMSIHGTDGVEVSGTVGAGTIGHGFYLEDASETDNVFSCNLGTGIVRPSAADALTPSDVDASVFWISNPDNTVVGNIAVGGFAGYSLSFPDRPVGLSTGQPDRPRTTPLRAFRDNVAVAPHFAGVFIDKGERPDRRTDTTWYAPRVDPTDESSAPVTPVLEDVTVFKSRHYGVWLRTFSGVELRRLHTADTWRSVYAANVQTDGNDTWATITDSLFVGESDNVGTPNSWENLAVGERPSPKFWDRTAPITGVSIYDGPLTVRDSTFARFTTTSRRPAGAIGSQAPNEFSVDSRSTASGLTFSGANRAWFGAPGLDGDDGTLIRDLDGSLTGTAGSAITVSGALLDDASCRRVAGWNASHCVGGDYARLYLMRKDGGDADVTVRRTTDGRTASFVGGGTSKPSVRTDAPYRVSWRTGDTGIGRTMVMVADRTDPTDVIDISLPHPAGRADLSFWQAPHRPAEASSLAALRAGGQGWWIDDANQRLYLRIAGRGVTIEAPTWPTGGGATSGGTTSGGTASGGTTSGGTTSDPLPSFSDVAAGNVHAANIAVLAAHGITRGCGDDRFCPDDAVTRAQMATFLVRALHLPPARTPVRFSDVTADNVHAANIAALAAAGITRGCGDDRFCPDQAVTRAQMATFLVRALRLPPAPTPVSFSDVDARNVHAANITALAAAGITRGCGDDRFCPDDAVTRAQMATFLVRALRLR